MSNEEEILATLKRMVALMERSAELQERSMAVQDRAVEAQQRAIRTQESMKRLVRWVTIVGGILVVALIALRLAAERTR